MKKKVTSLVRIGVLCLLALVGVAVYAYDAYDAWQRDDAAQRTLASYLGVQRLPASARDIECREIANSCEPDNPSTMCFVRIEPADFDLLANQARLRKNEESCPENFSQTHQMDLTVGPSFKINEEHWGGSEQFHADLYPDAAHSQFVAVLWRPRRTALRCN
jgi:hypothetical protein